MTKQDEKRHNRGIESLVKRLLEKNYDVVLMNPVYHTKEYCGELDVLAIRGDHATYYEIKGHNSYNARRKARNQIHRVQEAFPHWNVRGVYVPLDGKIKRIQHKEYENEK